MRLRVPIGRSCVGLGLMVSLAWLGPGLRADEPRRDWSRVQALPSGQQIVVKPFKGMGPKVKGAYVSSDADRLIVRRQNGREATISKDRIHLVARKRSLRNTVLIGTVAGFAIGASLTKGNDFNQPQGALFFGGIFAGIGALGGLAARGGGIHSVVYQVDDQDRRRYKTP